MHPIITKTFGGLSTQYYIRHFIFGLIFPVFFLYMMSQGKNGIQIGAAIFMVVSAFLYPYSRFFYESIVDFIIGSNTFFVNAILVLFFKFLTMALCFSFAIFIAPIGLAYLYFYHSKK